MAGTFVYATCIRTTPEKRWGALTNGDCSERYWMGFRFEVERKPGGRVRILPPKDPERYGDHASVVVACEPLRKLVCTFAPEDRPEIVAKRAGPSRVTYELTPMGNLAKLRLVHENLLPEDLEPNPDTIRAINNGWPATLSGHAEKAPMGRARPRDWQRSLLPLPSQGCRCDEPAPAARGQRQAKPTSRLRSGR
jgi:uncharacterized protein YndB with AHSA1/START domain